jgi:hypothetical protein
MEHILLEDGGAVMVMDGLPGWLFGLAVALVVLLSFVVVEVKGLPDLGAWRVNLSASKGVHRLLRKRWFQPAIQLPFVLVFLGTIYAGLFGSFARNIAPVLVWTIWWAALIFAVALLGNLWCLVCPWDALASWITRLGGIFKKRPSLSLGLKLPDWLANVYPAILLFVVLTWMELGWGITNNPRQTATLGLGMVASAVGVGLIFEKKAFCQSFCFVGRISGMYSMFSPVEIRPRDSRVCGVCTTRDCLVGGGEGYACPVELDLGKMDTQARCTSCTECFKSCPTLTPAVQLRAFNQDVAQAASGRMDEAWLCLTLLALTGFHGLSMTPTWQSFIPGTWDIVGWIRELTGLGQLGAFSVGMVAVMLVPVLGYLLCTWLAWLWTDERVAFRELFISYAYSLLPVALFYHLAHNTMHLFMEGQDVVPLLSDPMWTGADWFGTATLHLEPLLSQDATWYAQVVLICIGHVAGVLASHRIAKRLFPGQRGQAVRSLLPMLVMMVLLSICGLWLMHLDMNMRMGRM